MLGNSANEGTIGNSKLVTWSLCLSSFVAVIGLLELGWNIGVTNTPQAIIKQFINDSLTKRGEHIREEYVQILLATIVAIFSVGGLLGGLMAGWLADNFGRRNGMFINNLPMIIGGIFMLTGRYAWSFEMIIFGRLLAGFSSGIYSGLVPLYLNEIAPAQIRGILGLMYQLGVVVGIFLSEILGLSIVMGTVKHWNILLGLIIISSFLQAYLLKFCPYSPRYLLIIKENPVAAENALKVLRSKSHDIPEELEQITAEFWSSKGVEKIGFKGILHDPSLRVALSVGVALHLAHQLSGINVILYYSSTLFESVGVSKANSEYSTLASGAILFIITLIICPLIESCGRRILLIGGLFGCLCSSVCLTIFYSFHKTVPGFNYLSVVSALSLVASFGIGPGPIPWMMIPEMFGVNTRSTAMSVCVSVNWFLNILIGLVFPSLHDALGGLIFVPFIICQILLLVFLYRYMPETKLVDDNETGPLIE